MGEQQQTQVPRSRTFQTHRSLAQEIREAVEPVLFGSIDAGYAARRALEDDFCQEQGQAYACAVHSGTVGLFLALRACGIGAGDEVITVGNSDISTTAAIRHCGATPVLCDIRAEDYTIGLAGVEAKIGARTRAILPVDLYGHPADVRGLRAIADNYGLYIVEDAALATGAADYDRPVGTFADLTVFSFAPFKPLGSAGNGAIVTTNDAELARRLRLLAGYGHAQAPEQLEPGHQRYVAEGYNLPMDPLQAALVRLKLPYLPEWTARRQQIAEAYAAALDDMPARLPSFRAESAPTFRCYTIRVPQRQRVYQALLEAGVEVVLHYTPPAYRHPGYSGSPPAAGALPVTEQAAAELLCLPVAPELTDGDIAYACDVLRSCLRQLAH